MASKYGMKSKIPIKNLKSESSTEVVGKILKNSKPLKPLENKGKTAVEKEVCAKNKVSEVKQSKGNAEKLLQVTKEKAGITKKSPLQKPNQRAVYSTIKTLSKEMVNHLKAEKLHENKPSTESVDNEENVVPKKPDGATSKQISGERKATSPSLMVQPKNYAPHCGLMLKPTVKKTTVCFKPFKFVPSPAKLRRSQSEYDPDFERPKRENIRSQQKCVNMALKNKADQNMKPTKSSTLSKHGELISGVRFRQDIPVQSNKNVPVEKKPVKPLHLKSNPLGRSNTINALDSDGAKAENNRPQQKAIVKKDQKMEPTKTSTLSKHKELTSGVENKIQKCNPTHSNNPFIPPRTSKNLPMKNKPSKPLKRSSTIHTFDTAQVLKKVIDVRKTEPVHSKRIEEVNFENKTPVTPEDHNLSQLVLEDVENIHITPKKELPHGGLIFKLHAARKGNEKKFNFFSSVD